MIRKVLLSTVAIAAISGTAFAADLPNRRAPPVYIPPPVPVFTWTGFYVGGQVGYEFGSTNAFNFTTGVGPYLVGQTAAVIGGVHVGYNYQLGNALGAGLFGGGLVVGLEGDIEGSNNTGTTAFNGTTVDQHKGEIEGSLRGRLGIAVDRALFYVTGGAAFAQFHDNIVAGAGVDSYSNSKIGYTIGGGMAYAITPNWSLRAEYRYSDFGSYFLPAGANATDESRRVKEQKVEVGVSYRFAMDPVPVVARY